MDKISSVLNRHVLLFFLMVGYESDEGAFVYLTWRRFFTFDQRSRAFTHSSLRHAGLTSADPKAGDETFFPGFS